MAAGRGNGWLRVLLSPAVLALVGAALLGATWVRRDPSPFTVGTSLLRKPLPVAVRWSLMGRGLEDVTAYPSSDARYVVLRGTAVASPAAQLTMRLHQRMPVAPVCEPRDDLLEVRRVHDGAVQWTQWIAPPPSYGPMQVAVGTDRVYVLRHRELQCFGLQSGQELWRRRSRVAGTDIVTVGEWIFVRAMVENEPWSADGERVVDPPQWLRTLGFGRAVAGPDATLLGDAQVALTRVWWKGWKPGSQSRPQFQRRAARHLRARIVRVEPYNLGADRWYAVEYAPPNTLHAFDGTGSCRWERRLGFRQLLSFGGRLVVPAFDDLPGWVLDAHTGHTAWPIAARDAHCTLSGTGRWLLFYDDPNGTFVARRNSDGRVLWKLLNRPRLEIVPLGNGFLALTGPDVTYAENQGS